MTDRNSPGRTLKDTLSTAVIGPSGVSNWTTISSATRMAFFESVAAGIGELIARSGHDCGDGGSVTRFDPNIDDGKRACLDGGNRFLECGRKIGDFGHRAESLCALRACHSGKINVGFRNSLADPAVFNRP